MEIMETPNSRSEFEHRFHYLANIMDKGRFKINHGVSTEGLQKVRYLPNGRIDFLSVDESARNTSNTIFRMRDMKFSGSVGENENSHKD